MKFFKAGLFAIAAFATALGVSVPAFAGGGYGHGVRAHHGGGYAYRGSRGYHRNYYRPGRHYRGGRHFRGGRYYGRRHYRGRYGRYRRGGGGRGAAIALGVIGGAIILNEVLEEDRRRSAHDNRRYRDYDPRRDDYYYRRGEERAPAIDDETFDDRDFEDGRLEREALTPSPSDPVERDDLDDDLLGGEEDIGFSVQTAFNECSDEARAAARRDGQLIAMPARPTDVEALGGGVVRMTADLTAQDQRGGQFLRRLTCEADARRITFLQLS